MQCKHRERDTRLWKKFLKIIFKMDQVLLGVFLVVLQLYNGAFGQVSEGSVRLINGPSNVEGKVQIYYDGEWGVVCDDNWDLSDGAVVCRQLGFYGVYKVHTISTFGVGNWTILLDEVQCDGTEETLANCSSDGWKVHDCLPQENAGVWCQEEYDPIAAGSVRLADGLSPGEGRVEFYRYGEWGTVCGDGWDVSDAAVVCRQLGFPGAQNAFTGALFGDATGTVWLREVRCSGTELRLSDCPEDGYASICSHSKDAGVRCLLDAEPADGSLRLMNGNNSNEGRLEVYHDNEWGTICDNKWGLPESKVACRQLGFKGADGFSAGAEFGKGSGQVWLDTVDCKGNENSLDECSLGSWALGQCNHDQDVGVKCSYTEEGDARLVDGNGDAHGRVEVYHQGIWGTVCNKGGWNSDAAEVVCRGLGYDRVRKESVGGVPGGTGLILLEIESCIGWPWEKQLRYCDHMGWGRHSNCTHDDDVAIQCKNDNSLARWQIASIVISSLAIACGLFRICLKCSECCDCDECSDTNHPSGMPTVVNVTTIQDVEASRDESPNSPESDEGNKPPPSYEEINNFPESKEDAGPKDDTRL